MLFQSSHLPWFPALSSGSVSHIQFCYICSLSENLDPFLNTSTSCLILLLGFPLLLCSSLFESLQSPLQTNSTSLFLRQYGVCICLLVLLSSFNHWKHFSVFLCLSVTHVIHSALPTKPYMLLLLVIYLLFFPVLFFLLFFFSLKLTDFFCSAQDSHILYKPLFALNSYFLSMSSKQFFFHVGNSWKLPFLICVILHQFSFCQLLFLYFYSLGTCII